MGEAARDTGYFRTLGVEVMRYDLLADRLAILDVRMLANVSLKRE